MKRYTQTDIEDAVRVAREDALEEARGELAGYQFEMTNGIHLWWSQNVYSFEVASKNAKGLRVRAVYYGEPEST